MNIELVSDSEILKTEALYTKNTKIIWEGKEKLYKILEDIDLSPQAKIKLDITSQVYFSKGALVRLTNDRKFEAEKLSDILSRISSFDEIENIVINSNDQKEVMELSQAFLDLGYIVDILTAVEIIKKRLVKEFIDKRKIIADALNQSIIKIRGIEAKTHNVIKRKEEIVNYLVEARQQFEDGFDRVIRVAIFATKKAGKSMIVNALLGEEYAPTSNELPTPNVIHYIPYKDKNVKLIYKGRAQYFDSAKELKQHLLKEFKNVEISGNALDEMEIYYPAKERINYEIWDTPGPDLAGSEHGEIVKNCIEKVDVSIFVIDYSKYAQDSEIELLKEVLQKFTDKKKIYSFIVAVNKLDQMYMDADTEKLRIRVTGFIRDKLDYLIKNDKNLKDLGPINFVVIPVTALHYFYINKVIQQFPDIKPDDNFAKMLYELDNILYNEKIENELSTYIGNSIDYVKKIGRTFKTEIPPWNLINREMGLRNLEKYVDYITREKAFMELIWHKLYTVDTKLTNAENSANGLVALAEEVMKVQEAIKNFNKKCYRDAVKKEFYDLFTNFKENLNNKIKDTKNKINDDINELFDRELKTSTRKDFSKQLEDYYIPKLKQGKLSKDEFVKKVGSYYIRLNIDAIKDTTKERFNRLIEVTFNSFHNTFEVKAKDKREWLEKSINELNRELSKDFKYEIKFKVPDFDVPFDFEILLKDAIADVDENVRVILNNEIFDDAIKGGFFRWLLSFVDITERYKVDKEKIIKEFEDQVGNLLKDKKIVFKERITDKVIVQIENILKNYLVNKEKEVENFLESIYKPIDNIERDLNIEKEEKEKMVKLGLEAKEILTEVKNLIPTSSEVRE